MYLDNGFKSNFHKPGTVHHARFMAKGLYYLKLALLMGEVAPVLKFDDERVEEIHQMALFIAVFYTPKFLTAENPDISPAQVMYTAF